MASRKVKVKLVRSLIGRPEKHRKIATALGLYKVNQVVDHFETEIITGMIQKISHLIQVEVA